MDTRTCQQCGTPIKGRTDKKFCDDLCRTAFNNHLKADTTLMRNINNLLRKNRKIIESLMTPEETKSKTSRKRLEMKGFTFSYYTHTHVTKTGSVYYFCYEYGYHPLQNDHYLLVKWTDD